ncbi:hypothetical protein CISG_05379 [Coccidioides immitis RMSCC 3703]|uniref:Uncharacterized protein n=1 Tax=Coccidioides immitis RMSCC 3703 TaxID=454286 RepID=A0A0J8QST2_COCIT|nr:hypothetical protein CISG_05379 [Coccidioides immitis RMSCC 3703]
MAKRFPVSPNPVVRPFAAREPGFREPSALVYWGFFRRWLGRLQYHSATGPGSLLAWVEDVAKNWIGATNVELSFPGSLSKRAFPSVRGTPDGALAGDGYQTLPTGALRELRVGGVRGSPKSKKSGHDVMRGNLAIELRFLQPASKSPQDRPIGTRISDPVISRWGSHRRKNNDPVNQHVAAKPHGPTRYRKQTWLVLLSRCGGTWIRGLLGGEASHEPATGTSATHHA